MVATGREARPPSATLVTMTTGERTELWCGAEDAAAFTRWVADRAAGCGPHLVPITRVGRCPRGHLAAEVLRPAVRSLDAALDVLGVPTSGVAVTLSVPLLELAHRGRAGALELGAVAAEGIGVDEAGAVVVADRPPGGAPCCPDPHDGSTDSPRSPSTRTTFEDRDGARGLLTAARTVWDRTDPREPARAALDPLLDAARAGDADVVRAALDAVLAAAPPRPVRWVRPAWVSLGTPVDPSAEPTGGTSPSGGLDRALVVLREVVEQGVPIGASRRVPLRMVLVGLVVVVGVLVLASAA